MNYLKFKEVPYNELKLGTKYIITDQARYIFKSNKVYVGIFNGYCNKYTVSEITNWGKTHISYSQSINKKKYKIGDISFNRHTYERTYLVLDSQREIIQNNMESRALNIILRRLIGDNSFYY
jgi:hypothetical protein